jgi:hypothetical protein
MAAKYIDFKNNDEILTKNGGKSKPFFNEFIFASYGLQERELEKKNGGRNWIRTSEGVCQQIYSLPPLATWVSYHP